MKLEKIPPGPPFAKGGVRGDLFCLWLFILLLLPVGLRAGVHNDFEAQRWLQKAIDAYDREDYGSAKTNLQMALQAEPNFSEAYLLKGMLEYHDGLVDNANVSWKRALELNPHLPGDMRKQLEKRAHAIEANL